MPWSRTAISTRLSASPDRHLDQAVVVAELHRVGQHVEEGPVEHGAVGDDQHRLRRARSTSTVMPRRAAVIRTSVTASRDHRGRRRTASSSVGRFSAFDSASRSSMRRAQPGDVAPGGLEHPLVARLESALELLGDHLEVAADRGRAGCAARGRRWRRSRPWRCRARAARRWIRPSTARARALGVGEVVERAGDRPHLLGPAVGRGPAVGVVLEHPLHDLLEGEQRLGELGQQPGAGPADQDPGEAQQHRTAAMVSRRRRIAAAAGVRGLGVRRRRCRQRPRVDGLGEELLAVLEASRVEGPGPPGRQDPLVGVALDPCGGGVDLGGRPRRRAPCRRR